MTERQIYIEMARRRNMSDVDILRVVLRGYSGNKRRELVIEWGKDLGYDSTGALQLAHRRGLIPSASHPPNKWRTLPHIDQETTS